MSSFASHPMLLLPPELHARILLFLPVDALVALFACSRYWHELAESNKFWRRVYYAKYPAHSFEREILVEIFCRQLEDQQKPRTELNFSLIDWKRAFVKRWQYQRVSENNDYVVQELPLQRNFARIHAQCNSGFVLEAGGRLLALRSSDWTSVCFSRGTPQALVVNERYIARADKVHHSCKAGGPYAFHHHCTVIRAWRWGEEQPFATVHAPGLLIFRRNMILYSHWLAWTGFEGKIGVKNPRRTAMVYDLYAPDEPVLAHTGDFASACFYYDWHRALDDPSYERPLGMVVEQKPKDASDLRMTLYSLSQPQEIILQKDLDAKLFHGYFRVRVALSTSRPNHASIYIWSLQHTMICIEQAVVPEQSRVITGYPVVCGDWLKRAQVFEVDDSYIFVTVYTRVTIKDYFGGKDIVIPKPKAPRKKVPTTRRSSSTYRRMEATRRAMDAAAVAATTTTATTPPTTTTAGEVAETLASQEAGVDANTSPG
ncbi:hypothetical protein THASP1DRAFT_27099 [Thamnocephalis sphaerospora]|uniref:F-box domain-containing protein n=1 Tax=Thamnocephalis sphaerospora TaxID=78915 RepID=A0A4P9Y048_9FUNG|nr:hypothetical protein THASP1DRAFT_27099 [Thamnocephalis sphaerospora]|eukprot:RKP11120.1 hypothetical protein THASP1DRAFT_27099 [Thamnocephalis sphaerospora]